MGESPEFTVEKRPSSIRPSLLGVTPVSVPTAAQAAAQAIRDAILTGKLKPGSRLLEQKLAAGLRIGQPTLREAFSELEYQGLLCKGPGRGTYVSTLTVDDLRDLLEVRVILEASAIERAVAHLTPEAESELTAMVKAMAEAGPHDFSAFHNADVAFHRKLWALAGNEYFRVALERVAFRLFVFGGLRHGPKAFRAAVRQHEEILAALRSGDARTARSVFVNQTLAFWNEATNLGLEATAMESINISGAL